MKNLITLSLILFTTLASWAQQTGDVVLFTAGGERFYATINGVRQNMEAETNLKITALNQEWYKVTIIFEDQSIEPMVDKNLPVMLGYERVIQIKQNKKGKWVMRMTSEAPLASAPASGAAVVAYHTTPNPQPTITATHDNPGVQAETTTVSTTTTTTTSTDDVAVTTGAMGIDMGVTVNETDGGMTTTTSAGGIGMNVNININDGMGGTGATTYEETTVTTTSSTTTTGGGTWTEDAPVQESAHYQMPGYSGPIGCSWPMDNAEFSEAKGSIASKTFSDSKMTIAKQVTRAHCMTVDQVKEIMLLFDFEDDRLTYAKFAYDYTFDLQNYYKVNDAFDFESSIEELDTYIATR